MAFTINTNIASMQAQEYLRTTTEFQAKTINRVTSGLRIVNAGDDAAGLAIANSFRSDQAVLSQGIRNANDGLATLQTIDGGISNISKLLDRARSLATQSASGTFTGSRSVLDSEFQNVMSEIDRQAQAVGLNSNGQFAKSLSVFIGGGRTSGGVNEIDNGSVSVDLRKSTVDTQSLGLKGVVTNKTGYDLSSGTTRVESVVGDTNNKAGQAQAGFTTFRFFGPGFGDSSGVTVKVDVNSVASTDTLLAAVNAAIDSAGSSPTAAAQAFKNAGVRAKIVTDASGKQQLAFTSSNSAFQVYGGDKMANALLGDYKAGAEGSDISGTLTFGAGAGSAGAFGAGVVLKFRVEGGGLGTPYEFSYTTSAASATANAALLQTQIANDATLKAAGITMSGADPTSGLVFTSARGEDLRVIASGDTSDRLGLGAFVKGAGGELDYNTVTFAADTPTATQTTRFTFQMSDGSKAELNLAWTAGAIATDATIQSFINGLINGNSTLGAAGMQATVAAGAITFTAGAGTKFHVMASGSDAADDFGGLTGLYSFNVGAAGGSDAKNYIAAGSYQLGSAGSATPLSFSGIYSATEKQALTVQANDASGSPHSKDIVLDNSNARSIEEAIHTINTALQESNDATLKGITAVKVISGGVEKMTLISTNKDFRLSIGKNSTGSGFDQTNALVASTQIGDGSNYAITTSDLAKNAVTAISSAISVLGSAQAVVGKGQNQFNYAVSLASTQLTNLAASESRIRDADLAYEAANLTKAQILQQAGIAALAQANSAPQAVLTLLRG